jgi:hypothetical protein
MRIDLLATPARLQESARQRLTATDWWVTRHRDQLETGTPTTLSGTEYARLLEYRQQLRDWSKSGQPLLPVPPAFLVGTDTPPAPPTLAERKEKRLKELASRRFSHETKGINREGVRFQTDRTSRSNLQSLFNAADVAANKEFRWKAQDGWVTLNKAKVRQALAAVVDHVQACFDREEELAALIEASDNPEAVDITSGWPGGDSLD